MRKEFLIVCLLFTVSAGAQWKPAGNRIQTAWAEQIDTLNVLPGYPRPIMKRAYWKNLNGLWNFAILPVKRAEPATYQQKILVPFPVESSLSGVQQMIDDKQELCYNRTFTIPKAWKGKRILLHFGAVDWKAEIIVNGVLVGRHTGGYTPFCFDITPFLRPREQVLTVRVWDPTDNYFQPRGKQVSQPGNIVYTAVSGIWQTVWLEPVNETHITSLKILPDIDNAIVSVRTNTQNAASDDYVEVRLFEEEKLLAVRKAVVTEAIDIPVSDLRLWSPDSPFLYELEVSLYSEEKEVDKVESYCAMRKISMKRDSNGVMRLQLNNQTLFNLGMLDQGWFPDGLYTAATDEALSSDIIRAKKLGYNMLRKHLKVEPARWYTHCDRLGILVWQDMPSGDNNYGYRGKDYMRSYVDVNVEQSRNMEEARRNYRKEWQEIIDALYSYPSIVMWIPFNEGWGQFDTKQIAEWTKTYDQSRILNPASGGNFYHTGDVLDIHHYPNPEMFLYDADRVNVLGEYGGIGRAVEGHLWKDTENFGYEALFKTSGQATAKYVEFLNVLKSLNRFAGAVYTQATDVEGEVNGMVTYDRKVLKMDETVIRKANQELIQILSK